MPQAYLSTSDLHSIREDLDEGIELIEISHNLFQKKLAALESRTKSINDPRMKKELRKEALLLFSEYKNSLQVIEQFMQEAYKKSSA